MVSELSFSLFVCTYNGFLILIHISKGPICSLQWNFLVTILIEKMVLKLRFCFLCRSHGKTRGKWFQLVSFPRCKPKKRLKQKEKRRTFMALKFFPILNFMLPSFSSSLLDQFSFSSLCASFPNPSRDLWWNFNPSTKICST